MNSFSPYSKIQVDTSTWRLTRNDTFSCKSAYYQISNSSNSQHPSNSTFSWIWNSKIPNKIKYFLWLIQHNSLPTKETLHHIGIHLNRSCHIFNHHQENIHHIFFESNSSKSFLTSLSQKACPDSIQPSMFSSNN